MTIPTLQWITRNLLLICLIGTGTIAVGQVADREHEHQHEHVGHQHHKSEFGLAQSPVYFVNEKEVAYGLHAHLVRTLGNAKFGIGLGYERIFDEHKHNTFGIVGSYRPQERWVINVSPGFTFEDNADEGVNFALHLETAYEFTAGNFHIGPVLELAYDPEDYHISL